MEWLIGLFLSLIVSASALGLFMQQWLALREVAQRQRVVRELDGVETALRREWRQAGARQRAGPSAEHDAMRWSGSGTALQAQWRSDPGSGGRPSGLSTLRLQDQTLQLRTPSSGGFQSLHDPRSFAVAQWVGSSELSADCRELVRWSIHPAAVGLEPQQGTVRRRNHGLQVCEVGR